MKSSSHYSFISKKDKKKIFMTLTASILLFSGYSNTASADWSGDPTSPGNNKAISLSDDSTTRAGGGNKDGYDNWVIFVDSGARLTVGDMNAISIRNGVQITIADGALVTNNAVHNAGLFGTGANTIEVNRDSTITINGTVEKYGAENNGEVVNVHGSGNTIIVGSTGKIITENSAAIWFQDWSESNPRAKNRVENSGLIQRIGGGNVIGTSAGAGIIFINREGAVVDGSLLFASGNDELTFEDQSVVTGDIDGGGGINSLTLSGTTDAPDDPTKNKLAGALKNFSSLIKEDSGRWDITGPLTGYATVTVKGGTLGLTGNNAGYNGKVLIESGGTLEARAQSLPTYGGNIGNVTNNGTVRFNQPDSGTYVGQIVGTGNVEKIGGGLTFLNPQAAEGNTYTGGTTISGGTLAIAQANALGNGDISIGSGALQFLNNQAPITVPQRISLTSGSSTIDTEAILYVTVDNPITGVGALNKKGFGTLISNGNNTYRGGTYVAGGRLVLNGDNSQNTDTGVFGGVLEVNGLLGNTSGGNVLVAENARLMGLGNGTTTGVIRGNVVNAGTVAPGDYYSPAFGMFTIQGDYIGQPGGAVEISAILGDDSSPTSLLHITGGTDRTIAPSIVRVINEFGVGGITANGIPIIQIDGANRTENDFTLAYDYKRADGTVAVVGGAYLYTLQYGGTVTGDDGKWYLANLRHATKPGEDPGKPILNPSVPLYEVYPQVLLDYLKLGTLEERVGNRRWFDEKGTPNAEARKGGLWIRLEGESGLYRPDHTTSGISKYDTDLWRLQLGADRILYQKENGSMLVGGLNAHIRDIKAQMRSIDGDGKISTDGKGIGGILTWYDRNGSYLDAQAQATWFDSDITSHTLLAPSQISGNDGFGYGFSLEAGKKIDLKPRWSLTPQAQISYINADFDRFRDVHRVQVERNSADSLVGRLGVALNYERFYTNSEGIRDRHLKLYGIVNAYHEFHDGSNVNVGGMNFSYENDPTWLGFSVGGTYTKNNFSVYGEIGIRTSANNFGDSHAFAVKSEFAMVSK